MIKKLSKNVHWVVTLLFGVVILMLVYKAELWVQNQNLELLSDLAVLKNANVKSSDTIEEIRSLVYLKSHDLQNLTKGLTDLARSKKSLYEAGLSLQEERRLLEKQYEIMTTYLMIDEQTQKISLMRGEQSLQDFKFNYSTVTAWGGETKLIPAFTGIVSKERFAHPERGTLEEVDGSLVWNPPQVGASVRSNALGEYVMFTSGALILHGPPKKKAEHESYPHLCLGMTSNAARKLYLSSFIGTKIVYKKSPVQSRPQ